MPKGSFARAAPGTKGATKAVVLGLAIANSPAYLKASLNVQ